MNQISNAAYRHIETHPIAGSLGAEVSGVDLAALTEEIVAELRAALLAHQVIFLRDQRLTPDQQLGFARRFGEIHLHPFMRGMEDHPEILEIVKLPTDSRNFGGAWHTDQMFAAEPAMGTILYAKQVPGAGGDTLFTNQYLAYETLSAGMRRLCETLRGVCYGDGPKKYAGQSRRDFYAGKTTMQVKDPGKVQTTSTHPLVRTHPETGRKALYIGGHLQHFADMTDAESRPLIDFLMAHSTRPEFTCRFRWQSGSLAFWDNRCTQHFAINDYPAETRIMHRITVRGDRPY